MTNYRNTIVIMYMTPHSKYNDYHTQNKLNVSWDMKHARKHVTPYTQMLLVSYENHYIENSM